MLLAEGNIHLYTDHRNLLFVFNPIALNPALARHMVRKMQRWGLYLSRFSYAIKHVKGEKNIMADIMTRWWRGYRGERQAVKRNSHVLHQTDIAPSPLSEQLSWPDEEMMLKSQAKYASEACQASRDQEMSHSHMKANCGSRKAMQTYKSNYWWLVILELPDI